MGIGSTSLIIGLLIKLIPEGCFASIKLFKESPHVEESESKGIMNLINKPIDTLK